MEHSITAHELFKALADETRLRALVLLTDQGELCVCELAHALAVSQPKMSRHLATLRSMGVVADRREGTWVHYRLHPDLPAWAAGILRETAAGNRDAAPFEADRAALDSMPGRPQRCCPAA